MLKIGAKNSANVKPRELTFNDALVQFSEENDLPPEDRYMLMQIHYRGVVPETVADWWYIYTSIKLVLKS